MFVCVLLVVSLCSCSSYDDAYSKGYNAGYEAGQKATEAVYDDTALAYAQGYTAGYDDGIDVGYQNCLDDHSTVSSPAPQKSDQSSVHSSGSQPLTLSPSSSSSDLSIPSEPSQPVYSSVTVYITENGEKYHADGCSYLRNSKIPISKDEAILRNYTPCSRCKP